MIPEGEPAGFELLECSLPGYALHLCPIGTPMTVPWIEQPGVQPPFVAQQQQPFGIRIQPAERINSPRQLKRPERSPAGTGLGRELGKDAVRLVKGDQHGRNSGRGFPPDKRKSHTRRARPVPQSCQRGPPEVSMI